jgi:hypothetical protein
MTQCTNDARSIAAKDLRELCVELLGSFLSVKAPGEGREAKSGRCREIHGQREQNGAAPILILLVAL